MAQSLERTLKKGDILIREGDSCNSMFWLQQGSVRLFKKKNDGMVELGILHSGELVGEMSFLDKKPRSASVEAMQTCVITEIPQNKYDAIMGQMPKWVDALITTLVRRLRSGNNRVRELESNSTVFTQNADGKTEKRHDFLSVNEILRITMALIMACSRKGSPVDKSKPDENVTIRAGWLQLYGSKIMKVLAVKIESYTSTLQDAEYIRLDKEEDKVDIVVFDVKFLEGFLQWYTEEHYKAVDKQINLSNEAMVICGYVHNHIKANKIDTATEELAINMHEIFMNAVKSSGLEKPFDLSNFESLVESGLASELRMQSASEKLTTLKLKKFSKLYPYLELRQRFFDLNETKRTQL